ncbi:hypothetical protein LQZ18_10110 [Lachnospiraceae bacterium ZAX-1]
MKAMLDRNNDKKETYKVKQEIKFPKLLLFVFAPVASVILVYILSLNLRNILPPLLGFY